MTTPAVEPEAAAVDKPMVEKVSVAEKEIVSEPAAKKVKGNDGEAVAKEPVVEEPAAKEVEPAVSADKSEMPGWPDHKMNVNLALVKDCEGKRFSEVVNSKVEVIQGIGEKAAALCENFGITSVGGLADFKFYKMAKAIAVLAALEEKDARAPASVMNIDQAVDSEYEVKSLVDVLAAPVSALQGMSEKGATFLGELHVKTVQDLADFKYCAWAEAIVFLAGFEHKKSAAERKAERLTKRLE